MTIFAEKVDFAYQFSYIGKVLRAACTVGLVTDPGLFFNQPPDSFTESVSLFLLIFKIS